MSYLANNSHIHLTMKAFVVFMLVLLVGTAGRISTFLGAWLMDRTPRLVTLLLFISTFCTVVRADDIADTLAAAKREFSDKLESEIASILEELRLRLAAEADAGDLEAVEVTEAEIEALIESRTLPKSISTKELQSTVKNARAELETSYKTAISDYTKAKQIKLAKKVRDELSDFKKSVQSLQPIDVSTHKFVVISSPASGKLVSISGGSIRPGAQAIQWEPVELHAEMSWEFIASEDGWFYIMNRKSSLALGVDAALKTDGANVVQWPLIKNHLNHQWRTVPVSPKTANLVMIENRNSSKFLSLENASSNNGVRLVQSGAISNSQHQIWQVIPVK